MTDWSALRDFPRELSLTERRGRWVLSVHGPMVSGFAESHHRELLAALAETYAEMRRAELGRGAAEAGTQ